MVFHWVSRTKSWIEIDFSFGGRKILHRTIQRKTIKHDTDNGWGNIMLAWHKTPIICWSCFRKVMIVIFPIRWMTKTIIHRLNFIKGRIATARVVRTKYRYTVGCISDCTLVSISCLLFMDFQLEKLKQIKLRESLPPKVIKQEQSARETNLIALLWSRSILSMPKLNDLEYHSNQFGFSDLLRDTF